MNFRLIGAIIGILILIPLIVFATGAVYIVPETHSAVITRFGEVQSAVVSGFYQAPGTSSNAEEIVEKLEQSNFVSKRYADHPRITIKKGAGWYLKIPFVDTAHYFDSRLLDWDGERKEVATRDLRTLLVDSASRWRILDPIQYFESIGPSVNAAQDRLDGVVVSQIEDQIANTRLIEAVRNQNLSLDERVKERLETVSEEEVDAANIRYGRMEMIRNIQKQAGKELRERFGIQLVDLMITQLNYTEQVREQVYQRMIAERKRIANRYRAQGERARREILGAVQREEDEILSRARQTEQEILGNAEAKRIEIMSEAHQLDSEFFRYWRTLQAYEEGLDTGTRLIFSDENQLFEYSTSPME